MRPVRFEHLRRVPAMRTEKRGFREVAAVYTEVSKPDCRGAANTSDSPDRQPDRRRSSGFRDHIVVTLRPHQRFPMHNAHLTLTTHNHELGEVISALQKTIRRNDVRLACYFSMELFESGFEQYAWRRLLTISAEDCHGCVTAEIWALYHSAALVKKTRRTPERIFLAKAAIILAQAPKSRDADHASCLMYDLNPPDDATVRRAIQEARATRVEVPDYAYDCHTRQGKRAGKTREDFFLDVSLPLSSSGIPSTAYDQSHAASGSLRLHRVIDCVLRLSRCEARYTRVRPAPHREE